MSLRHLVIALALAGCGGTSIPASTPDLSTFDGGDPSADIRVRLASIPGATVVEQSGSIPAGYRYFIVHLTQPVDHQNPKGQTFQQEISILHKDLVSPLILSTTGYDDYQGPHLSELAKLFAANQVSIEHRFFGSSVPSPADWTKLTIQQMAADEHVIATVLKKIYRVKTLATGGSKGGMTALFFRRFYPDDVDGTVPYVAPLSFGAPDGRYVPYLDALGTAPCRQAVRDLAVEMLSHRRAAMVSFAQAEATVQRLSYNRVQIGPAVESAIFGLEWSFWQYSGVGFCDSVPPVTASDLALWTFLDQSSPVGDLDDDSVARFGPYFYQSDAQLGFPADETYLDQYGQYGDNAYAGANPVNPPPDYDPSAMLDIDTWVQTQGSRLLFIYGEWDPWSGGMFRLGSATDSAVFVAPQGTHNSQIKNLAAGDLDAARAMLRTWLGIQITGETAPEEHLAAPRAPPALRMPPISRVSRSRTH